MAGDIFNALKITLNADERLAEPFPEILYREQHP